ncbi:MAG TPA: D-alanine--D-alanine ligase [Pirellulales bacterium]|nr:D-alanine--D-alanine ligase [Pirellulales bacterium]
MYDVTAGGRRVAVLAGGDSAERNVSLASGQAVTYALTAAGYRAEMFDPAAIGLYQIDWSRFEVCFIALHGGAGEDGRVQAELESLGVPFTGSGPAASERAMSKSATKERFVAAGVPTAEYCVIAGDDGLSAALSWAEATGFPLVVKPDREGSSIGVGFAADAGQLRACVADAQRFDTVVLVERWIDGREFTVAVLGREPLPTLEIVTPRGLFDYEAKYESALTEYRFEHGLPAAAARRLTDAAIAAAESVDTSGLVRVDVMLDRYCQPWVLEVNTVPGLTDHSLAPKAAEQAGMNMPDLCRWMIEDALLAEAKR